MATKLTAEEEQGFRTWYKAKAIENNLPEDPDEEVNDNGEFGSVDHRKFFKRMIDDPDFADGVDNLISHSQTNLDTGRAKYYDDGSVSTIYSTSMGDDKGIEHIYPTVWGGSILEDGDEIYSRSTSDGLKWPTASSPDEATEISKWVHKLVMNQKPRTPVGQRALKMGY